MHCNVGASVPGARSICTTKVIRYSNLGATDLDATEQSGLIWAFVRAAQRTHAHRTPTGQIGLPTAGQTVCSAPILPYSGIYITEAKTYKLNKEPVLGTTTDCFTGSRHLLHTRNSPCKADLAIWERGG